MPDTNEPYDGVVVFDESESVPIVGRVPSAYAEVIVFDDSDAEIIMADPPASDGAPSVLDVREEVLAEPPARREQPYRRVLEDPSEGRRSRVVEPAPARLRTTGPQDRPDWWPEATGISFELQDAWLLPPPEDIDTELPLPQTQVLSWLRAHREMIDAAARRRGIDRRAIAAAIAWEALVNVRSASWRAVGPGKVHVDADVVRETEAAGYLPRRTSAERERILATPAGAVDYIAAVMAAKADIAAVFGFDIRKRVDILTNEYQGRSLREWNEHLLGKRDATLEGRNSMATWSLRHLHYVELAGEQPAAP
ncbi:hypothetical protein [Streptomyces sp. 351MFTsu5.1]|uniref:hypothetical protein n=1 Tax=Streptomyces sp. 351MFTsu5.1 TaxID=1172180 RepID=UPI00037307A8|nr:hypothetical protein [Streptomyces sp. 351MFTsu5.1]